MASSISHRCLGFTATLLLAITGGVSACSGGMGPGAPGGDDDDHGAQDGPGEPGEDGRPVDPPEGSRCTSDALMAPRLVRLTEQELHAVIETALVGLPDAKRDVAFNLQGDHLTPAAERSVSSADLASYRGAARTLARDYVASLPAMHACKSTGGATGCLDTLMKVTASLYRREATEDEREAMAATHGRLLASHGPALAAEAVVMAALLAPQTLYRTEAGESGSEGRFRLTADEAAQMISLSLRGRPALPDEIADLAGLDTADLKQRLGDLAASWTEAPEFHQRVTAFLEHYLGASHLFEGVKDDPIFDDDMKTAMIEEFDSFVATNFLDGEATFADLYAGNRSKAIAALARIYTEPNDGGTIEWREGNRKGALGLAAVLAANASPNGSDPVKRGILVRQHLLCETLPPPDPNVDFSKLPEVDDMQTRERFEVLGNEPSCKSCHSFINPPGYLFEEFDELGRYRAEQLGRPINASGSIPPLGDEPYPGTEGEEWVGLGPLADWLSTSTDAKRCFSMQFLAFALAADLPEGADNCGIDRASEDFRKSGRLRDLVRGVVASDLFLFRSRQGDEQ